jgi:SAM-dependent methyltransferase
LSLYDHDQIAFRCNICGLGIRVAPEQFGRELVSCGGCGSTVRMRGVIRCLSLALFGRSLTLAEMPADRSIRGIGLSDWDEYANRLAGLFSYRNTFLHAEPKVDIVAPPAELAGSLDFLIASDVFEHVPPPVDRAFAGAFALLKPGGTLILTVPYTKEPETIEHFPDLHDPELLDFGPDHYLLDRRRDGSFRIFDNLNFHGGPGQTLEMRLFCEADLTAQLRRAGFEDIIFQSEDDPTVGVIHPHPWGFPVTAAKPAETRRDRTAAFEASLARDTSLDEIQALPVSDAASVAQHLASIRPRLDVDDAALLELFWYFHPRFRFLKSLPWAANLLDIGAGNGGLAHWRGWAKPDRSDLRLYGVDRREGEHRPLYAGWETIDLDRQLPDFPDATLNAFLAAHLIEHLSDPKRLIRWIAERAEPGSRVYLEWPNPDTLKLPTREQLLGYGIDVVISNFHDDSTHQDCPDLATVTDWLSECGFIIGARGSIDLGILGEEVFARASEPQLRTMGYWSMTRWCVFVEAMKPSPARSAGTSVRRDGRGS